MDTEVAKILDRSIRRVPDFPKKGILFYDISTLLKDKKAFKIAIDEIIKKIEEEIGKDSFDKVASIESRGFIFGSAIAYKLEKGFVIVRKEGKLPAETLSYTYGLEYGTATIEIHTDSVEKGEKLIVVDDVLATGGTALATCKLIKDLGGEVKACVFLIELEKTEGRKKIEREGIKVISLLKYW